MAFNSIYIIYNGISDAINSLIIIYVNINLMFDEQAAIVIDNGSFEIKAGFSAEDLPICSFRSIIGRPKSMISYAFDDEVYVGDMAFCKKVFLNI